MQVGEHGKQCTDCRCFGGVDSMGQCVALTGTYNLETGFNIPYASQPITFKGLDGEVTGFLQIATFAGQTCPHFERADESEFCRKCGRRLGDNWNNCAGCGEEIECK